MRELLHRISWARLAQLAQRREVRLALKALVLALVVVFVVYAVVTNWGELQQYEWQADWRYLALSALFFILPATTGLWAWHRVMTNVGAMPKLRVNALIYCYSTLPKRIPGVIWYIASRAQLYKEKGVARSVTILGTILETALLIVSALLIYLLSLLFPTMEGMPKASWNLPPAVAVLFLIPFLVLLYPPAHNRLFGYLLRRLRFTSEVSLAPRASAELLLIYGLAWILGGIDLYLLANAVQPIPLQLLPAVIGAWAASGAVSFVASYLVQGMGLTEVTLAALLSSYLPLPVAIVISILFRILLTICEVVWALLLAWILSGFRLRRHSTPAAQ